MLYSPTNAAPTKAYPFTQSYFNSAWVAEDVSCFQLNSEKRYKHFEVNVTGHLCTDQSQKIVKHTCKPQSHRLITSDVC